MKKPKSFSINSSLLAAFQTYCEVRDVGRTAKLSQLLWDFLKDNETPGVQDHLHAYINVMEASARGFIRGRQPEFNPLKPLQEAEGLYSLPEDSKATASARVSRMQRPRTSPRAF